MIVEKLNIKPTTGWTNPYRNRNFIQQFKTIVFVNPDFQFDSLDDLKDRDIWIQGVKDKNLIPILDSKNVTPQPAQTQYETGEDEITILIRNGRYIFTMFYFVDFNFHKLLKYYSQQDYDVIFIDFDNNVVAYSPEGTYIKGLEANLINVEDMEIGDQKISWTPLYIELADSKQYNDFGVVEKVDFKLNKLNVTFVNIIDISGTQNYIKFSVVDENFGYPISGLSETDIVLNDTVNGLILFNSLREISCGVYDSNNLSELLNLGDIVIDTDYFYGSAEYEFNNPLVAVTLQNVTVNSYTSIDFDLIETISTNAVTDLLQSEVQVVDDVSGNITIGLLTHNGAGNYSLTGLSPNILIGDINIIGSRYTGSGAYNYNVALDVVITTNNLSNQLLISVSNDGSPYTGLTASNFTLNETINTNTTKKSVSEISSGNYRMIVENGSRFTGSIDVVDGAFNGSGNYSYTSNYILNTGAVGTTDWIDSNSDGLADYIEILNSLTATIVTDTYFDGNIQRFDNTGGTQSPLAKFTVSGFKNNTQYKFRFKFRANKNWVMFVYRDDDILANQVFFENVGVSSGYHTTYETQSFDTLDADQILFNFNIVNYPSYVMIDEVELIEV